MSIRNAFLIVPWQENTKMKMLNFTLATAFIFYIVATSWTSYSLVFCSKVVLRLVLVHSKYTWNKEITAISIRQWNEILLLSLPPAVCQKRHNTSVTRPNTCTIETLAAKIGLYFALFFTEIVLHVVLFQPFEYQRFIILPSEILNNQGHITSSVKLSGLLYIKHKIAIQVPKT